MNIFIDSNIFLKLIEGSKRDREKLKTLLRHAKNAGYNFSSSFTVYGETLQIGLSKKKRSDLHHMIELIRDYKISCLAPNLQLRLCCLCLDKIDKETRCGVSDRTHLAYSMVYNDDYFLTNDDDLLHFPLHRCNCKRKCGRNNKTEGKIISPQDLDSLLSKKKK